jgi:hypothetical protein
MPAPLRSLAAATGLHRPRPRVHPGHRPSTAADHAATRPARMVPWGLIGAVVLIAIIEFTISQRWLPLSDPVGLSWRFSAQAASTLAPGCDVLCLGDSLVKHGVIPSVVEGTSGLRVANLSAARCPMLMTYYLFQQALAHGSRPRAIILNAKPAVLMGDPDYNAQYWPYALSLDNLVDFTLRTRRPQLIASVVLSQVLPSLRSRLQLRSSSVAAIQGSHDKLEEINPVLWRNWTANAGANVANASFCFSGELPADVNKKLHPNIFFAHPSNRSAFEQILELASLHQIHVFFLIVPIPSSLQELRDKSGADSRYEKFIADYQRRFPDTLTVLDARRSGYQNPDFIDATHLNVRGATALSRSVAAAIRSQPYPANARWIALGAPLSASSSIPSQIEDLDQSREHVQKMTGP